MESDMKLELGRESLGILPPDFGRGSLGFSNPAFLEEIQNNSLGVRSILQLSALDRESLSTARESLGILHLSSLDTLLVSQNSETPDLLLTTINEQENESTCDILNKAFIFPSPRKMSLTSSCSHLSFNANSIEEPSKIYSIPSLNDVFVNAKPHIFNNNNVTSSTENHVRLRIKSLPNISNLRTEFLANKEVSYQINSVRSILNEGKLFSLSEIDSCLRLEVKDLECSKILFEQKTTESPVCEQNGKININEANENEFHDSVFIEGKYFAEKIANGSILDNSFNNEVGILDNVPQPDWIELPKSPNNDLEVFVVKQNVPKHEEEVHPMPETDELSVPEAVELPVNEPDLKLNSSKIDHTPKSAKELLHNLSEILNNTTQSDQQRSEGQYLLNSLADLFSGGSNNRSCFLDDSGHSSSINDMSDPDKIQTSAYSAALDFSRKFNSLDGSRENDSVDKSLNPKIKSKLAERNSNRLSSSLSSEVPAKNTQPRLLKRGSLSKISLDSSRNRTGSSNSSVKSENLSNSNVLVSSLQSNLKVKAAKESSRKGPLKAVIPLKDLKKITRARTPEKSDKRTSIMQSTRTSTPIHEPKLKPMAASTPTQQPILKNGSDRKSCPNSSKIGVLNKYSGTVASSTSASKIRKCLPICTSPLVGNSKPTSSKQDSIFVKSPKPSFARDKPGSTSHLPIYSQESYSKRRNTITSFKNEQMPGRPRSNSLPKEPVGIMSSFSKIRENLLNSPEFKEITVLRENNKTNNVLSKENKKPSSVQSKRDLMPKFKKTDKENVKN